MNAKRKCMVGHDDDYGWIIAIAIAIFVIAVVCAIIFYGGAFIGGFHSINNVVDSNRKPLPVA